MAAELAARLRAGEPAEVLWAWGARRRIDSASYAALAALEPATLCAAVCLNGDTHPVLVALRGSAVLERAATAQQLRNAHIAEKLAGARRELASLVPRREC